MSAEKVIATSTDRGVPRSVTRLGVRALLVLVALVLVAVPFGLLLLLTEVRWSPLLVVDDGVRDGLHRYTVEHPAFMATMKALSTAGSARVYFVLFALVAAWLLYRRCPRLAAFVVAAELGGAMLNGLVKTIVARARPVVTEPLVHVTGMSFPSGHAQSAVVSYAALLVVFWSVLRRALRGLAVVFAFVMVIGIGLSRVALSVHYVSDVLAGYALGAAWIITMTAIFTAWRGEQRG